MTLWKALPALGLLILLTLSQAQGATAEADGAAEDEAGAAPSAPEGASASAPASSETTPAEAASSVSAPRRFIPTEQVSEDRAVAFPKDI
jgi:hypothetical protein